MNVTKAFWKIILKIGLLILIQLLLMGSIFLCFKARPLAKLATLKAMRFKTNKKSYANLKIISGSDSFIESSIDSRIFENSLNLGVPGGDVNLFYRTLKYQNLIDKKYTYLVGLSLMEFNDSSLQQAALENIDRALELSFKDFLKETFPHTLGFYSLMLKEFFYSNKADSLELSQRHQDGFLPRFTTKILNPELREDIVNYQYTKEVFFKDFEIKGRLWDLYKEKIILLASTGAKIIVISQPESPMFISLSSDWHELIDGKSFVDGEMRTLAGSFKNLNYIELSRAIDKCHLLQEDFSDFLHLNHVGAIKFSKCIKVISLNGSTR